MAKCPSFYRHLKCLLSGTGTMSVHPHIFHPLSVSSPWWQQGKQIVWASFSRATSSTSSCGDLEALQDQIRHIIPPVCSGSAPESPPCWKFSQFLDSLTLMVLFWGLKLCQDRILQLVTERSTSNLDTDFSFFSFFCLI